MGRMRNLVESREVTKMALQPMDGHKLWMYCGWSAVGQGGSAGL